MILDMANPDWSAYRDEVWEGMAPGTYGMAPRILHLFGRLGLSPGNVPASNLVFVRSRNEATMGAATMQILANQCWPFHAAVIKEELKPSAVLCLGKTAKQARSQSTQPTRKLLSGTAVDGEGGCSGAVACLSRQAWEWGVGSGRHVWGGGDWVPASSRRRLSFPRAAGRQEVKGSRDPGASELLNIQIPQHPPAPYYS